MPEIKKIPGEETNFILWTTDETVDVTAVKIMPFIDSHMHIMSTNCAPLTLQWTLVRGVMTWFADLFGITEKSREGLGEMSKLVTGDFGQIGILNTQIIANLFMSDIKEKIEMEERYAHTLQPMINITKSWYEACLFFARLFKDEKRKSELQQKIDDIENDEAYKKIKEMKVNRNKTYLSFTDETCYYFGNHKIIHMNVALPMDMSYAHYWARFGLPVYLPFQTDENGRTVTKYYFFDEWHVGSVLSERSVGGFGNKEWDRVFFPYDLNPFENHKNKKPEDYLSDFDLKTLSQDEIEACWKKRFKHYMKPVPNETNETFEDYIKQTNYTIGAAVKYPFQLLPFFHYDPRRYSSTPINEQLDGLEKDHTFFLYNKQAGKFKLKNDFFSRDYFNELLQEKNRKIKNFETKDYDEFKKIVNTSEESSDRLFWGFKIYPPLGYAPDDFEQYPQLEGFYQNCIFNKIPLLAHCSPKGMTIADTYVNLREAMKGHKNEPSGSIKSRLLQKEGNLKKRWDFTKDHFLFFEWDMDIERKDPYSVLANSIRFVDETCVSPETWKSVLDYKGGLLKGLTICLAHYGGSTLWKSPTVGDVADDIKKYDVWRTTITDMIKNYDNVYTDLSCYAFDYVGNEYRGEDGGLYKINQTNHFEAIVKKLSDVLNNDSNDKLKKHIMMGSDWYMFERTYKGVGKYYHNMFRILREVSRKLNNKYDAWYQFSVINPLRFLGILKDDDKTIDDDKLLMYKKNIIKKLNYSDYWLDKFAQVKSIKDVEISANNIYNILTNRHTSDHREGKWKAGDIITEESMKYLSILESKEVKDESDNLKILKV